MAGGSFGGGTGTLLDPYLVEDDLDLNAIRTYAQNTYFKLVANIDTSVNYSGGWTPLDTTTLSGHFDAYIDGDNYTISNLKDSLLARNRREQKNILVSVTINTSNTATGAICQEQEADGRLVNCHASGTITTSGLYVGGLIGRQGWMTDTLKFLEYCSSSVNVTSTSTTILSGTIGGVGGLVGSTYRLTSLTGARSGYIQDCKCTGTVAGSDVYVGGILGHQDLRTNGSDIYIVRCIATGNISAVNYAGGIFGKKRTSTADNLVKIYIQECVALMSSITRISGSATDFGRISSEDSLTYQYLQNNRALDTMQFL